MSSVLGTALPMSVDIQPPVSALSRPPVVVTLPDGKEREFPGPVTGAEIAAAIGPGLAKAAIAIRVDGRARDLATRIDHDAAVAIVTRDAARGARDPAPRRRPCHGRGGQGALPRDASHLRSGDRHRLLLRFRPRRAVHPRRSRADRGADARDRAPRREDHPRGLGPRRCARLLRRPSARSTRPNTSARSLRARRSASIARAALSISAPGRICLRPAISARRSS